MKRRLPIGALIRAVPMLLNAVRRSADVIDEADDDDSLGGADVTPEEVDHIADELHAAWKPIAVMLARAITRARGRS